MKKIIIILLLSVSIGSVYRAFGDKIVQPGTIRQLEGSDAVSDASGAGQLFECIHVPGFTDFVEGLNGFDYRWGSR